MLEIERFQVGSFGNNCFLLYSSGSQDALLIDPAMGSEVALDYLHAQQLSLRYILNTHGHFDHTFNNQLFKNETKASLAIHPDDADFLRNQQQHGLMWGLDVPPSPEPDVLLDQPTFFFDGESFEVFHAPGHSPGSVCFYLKEQNVLFCGDTVFSGSIGRTDLPGGDYNLLLTSIRNSILVLPDETTLYTGHGPLTTVGEERLHNPFLV